jgi:ketosteroid isomerase-like protein
MEVYFSTFDRIEYDYWDRSIQMEGEMATVIQQFHLEVEKGEKKNRHSGKEALLMRKEGKQWKIVKAL